MIPGTVRALARGHDRPDHEFLVPLVHHAHEHDLGDLVVGDLPDLDAPLLAPAGHGEFGHCGKAHLHQRRQNGVGPLRPDDCANHDQHVVAPWVFFIRYSLIVIRYWGRENSSCF
jgi:hypothetical protein